MTAIAIAVLPFLAACTTDEATREQCGEGASCATAPTVLATPPLIVGDAPLALRLEPTRVPVGTATVTLSLTASGPTDDVIGLAAGLAAWDGERWLQAQPLLLCTGDRCPITELPADAAVPSLGLTATPGAPTALGLLSVGELTPGWYRIEVAGATAAVLQVTAGEG